MSNSTHYNGFVVTNIDHTYIATCAEGLGKLQITAKSLKDAHHQIDTLNKAVISWADVLSGVIVDIGEYKAGKSHKMAGMVVGSNANHLRIRTGGGVQEFCAGAVAWEQRDYCSLMDYLRDRFADKTRGV